MTLAVPRTKLWRAISFVASTVLVTTYTLEFPLLDLLTPFLFPLLAGLVWVAFSISLIIALIQAAKFKSQGITAFSPIMMCCTALFLVFLIPFSWLWTTANYHWHKSRRVELVRQVSNREIVPNVSHNPSLIKIGKEMPYLSMGGNEIVVEGRSDFKYVFFYTYRGVLDNYNGFLFVPQGGDPKGFSDLNEAESTNLVQLEQEWFYAEHR